MSEGITITINAATDEAAAKLQEFFGGVTEKLDALTKAGDYVREIGGQIAAAFTLGGIVEAFKSAIESAEEFGKAVQKTGLSFQTLNALKTMGQNVKLPFEELTLGLGTLNERIFTAVRLGGQSAAIFREMGIQITDLKTGAMLPFETILREVLDHFHNLPDGIQKDGQAFDLLGRTFREFIPLFNEGTDVLDKMKATGGGITPEMAENAEKFNRSIVELKNSLEQVFLTASTQILPILQDLTGWFKTLETSTDGEAKASDGLVLVFKVLSTAVVTLKSGFVLLGEVIGDVLGTGFESLKSQVAAETQIFLEWWDAVKKIVASLFDIGAAALGASAILKDLALGNYAAANAEAKKFLERTKGDVASIATTLRDSTANVWSTISGEFSKQWAIAIGAGKLAFNQFFSEGAAMVSAWNSLWRDRTKEKPAPATGVNKPATAGAGAGAAGAAGGAPIVSEEAKKLMEQVEKEYRETTQSKLALLDFERDQMLKKLQEEIHDQKTLEEERTKQLAVSLAKRQVILDQQADHENKRQLEGVRGQIESVDKDPFTTELEKKKQLIPLLAQELTLLKQIQAAQATRAADPKRNDEEKNKAKDEVAQLDQEIAKVQDQSAKNMMTPLQTWAMQVKNTWGDLSTSLQRGAFNTIQQGVSGMSNALAGLIMGSKNAGQAFAQLGQSLLTSFISTIIESILWAEIAIPILTALGVLSGGATAGAGSALTVSAVAGGMAGVQAAIGHAEGGLIQGPGTGTSDSILARLSHGEFVIPASRVAQYGTDFFENIRQGAVAVHSLGSAGSNVITRPITSQPGASGDVDDGSAGAGGQRGGGNGGVTVQGHKVTFIQPANRQEMLDAMASAEGEKIVVGHAKKNRLSIGVGT